MLRISFNRGIFITIAIALIIFLLLSKNQESQAQIQDSLYLQERATQRPSHPSQQQEQIEFEERLQPTAEQFSNVVTRTDR
ncbi:hypothetical protein NHP200010_07930 [Helicobacter bizzozeronii]|uniref:hypothetical protein n=1 Tax=Helicobacter bizzozeronii TaxID=56877 RepID=UPI00244D9383|nr:hypothetical protein [Helicobacter bizzozeronii]GMB93081.1 hypothetical protein NHP200010_07930 [Helicobacter bizzozeronii]